MTLLAEKMRGDRNASAERKLRIAQASRASRAKRKRELEFLKRDNERLRTEHDLLKAKISQLQSQVDNNLSASELEMIAENSLLQIQLENHRQFVRTFLQLTSGAPTSQSAKESLCRQGAEAAQSYVQALISQSGRWTAAVPPKPMPEELEELSVHYQLLKSGLVEERADAKPVRRLNLRIDLPLPGVRDAKLVVDRWWKLMKSREFYVQFFGVEKLDMRQIEGPDPQTELLFQKIEREKVCVFVCNRKKHVLAKSTLASPCATAAMKNGEATGKAVPSKRRSTNPFGNVDANVCAMTATRSSLEAMRSINDKVLESAEKADEISSVVVQGATAYQDEATDACHFVGVFSIPEEYRLINVSQEDCFKDAETLSEKFSSMLISSFSHFLNQLYTE